MTQRPTYAVDAVDHTLAALTILTHRDGVRISDLATELGIGRSTAHRLLQMLVYREFAQQRPDRTYTAGPILQAARNRSRNRTLRQRLHPSLMLSYDRLQESVQVQVLSGLDLVSLESIECPGPERHGLRGARFPAERAAGGLALLAELSSDDVLGRVTALDRATRLQLERALAVTRHRGFGYSEGTEGPGLASLSVPVLDEDGDAVAALTCTAPSARLTRSRVGEVLAVLRTAASSVHETAEKVPASRRTG